MAKQEETINMEGVVEEIMPAAMFRIKLDDMDNVVIGYLSGRMVYDPDFRYELTGETVDPRAWKPERNRDRKDIKSKLGYSRIGLGNV